MSNIILIFIANIWKILQNNWGDGRGRLTDSMQILHGCLGNTRMLSCLPLLTLQQRKGHLTMPGAIADMNLVRSCKGNSISYLSLNVQLPFFYLSTSGRERGEKRLPG